MRIDVVTIFPEYLEPLRVSLLGRAIENGLIRLGVHDLRAWTHDVHRTVDDTPYGGGPGLVMKAEPWGAALDAVADDAGLLPRLVVPTPSGRPFTQQLAAEYVAEPWLLFACGRYEGIDARVVADAGTRMRVDEVSVGDYVLAGGEAAVLVIVETIARLLPGVLGNASSVVDDSFAPGAMDGLLEGPAYTKPAIWRGQQVPDVLVSGNHAAIARWRRDQALRRTASNRPDLVARLDPAGLDARDREVLAEVLGPQALVRFLGGPPSVAD
ncbi:MAG: tRNA (guanosine(37)-N1)-methyltransferase TrmD [Actinomycetes bacterium]